MITEELITVLPLVGSFLCIPLLFVIVYCRDMITLKLKTAMGRKKGVKMIVDITKDKNITIRAEALNKDSKIKRDGLEIEWEPTRQYFSPQLGVQAAMTVQGSQSIYDPIGSSEIDLADGEVVDRMVKRAELMRDLGAGWMDTKEQKLMMLVLVVCLATAGISFATSSQIGEFTEWARIGITGIQQAVTAIPRPL